MFLCFFSSCMLDTAQEWRRERIAFFNGIKYLPVILERRKNAVGNTIIKKYGVEWWQVNHFSRSKATLQKWVKRHTRPTGAVRIWQRIQELNIFPCVRTLAPIASQARHFPPRSGEADIKEERNYIFHYLNTFLRLSDAGFFTKSQIMFSFVIIPILPAAQEWRRGCFCFAMMFWW